MLPRCPRRGRGGRGSRGRGATTPTHVVTAENPLGTPAFRAQLSRLIAREIERITGRTLWNTNRGNVPPANVTQIRLIEGQRAATRDPESRAEENLPELPRAKVVHRAQQEITLPDRRTDRRTLILNLLIILVVTNFIVNIFILHHLVTI